MIKRNVKYFFSFAVGVLFLLLFLLPQEAFALPVSQESIFNLVNNTRIENNLAPLTLEYRLTNTAIERAEDMIEKNYFAHQSPGGKMPWDLALENNYDYTYIGENLGRDWGSAEEITRAWLQSSAHRENILNPNYSDTGIAVISNDRISIIVQIFGKELGDRGIINSTDNTPFIIANQHLTENDPSLPMSGDIDNIQGISINNIVPTSDDDLKNIMRQFHTNVLLFLLTLIFFPTAIYLSALSLQKDAIDIK